jgi:hypothetical protein
MTSQEGHAHKMLEYRVTPLQAIHMDYSGVRGLHLADVLARIQEFGPQRKPLCNSKVLHECSRLLSSTREPGTQNSRVPEIVP